ncbi:MAG: ferrochelatase [Chlorobi bacterium]|nr:ferrochelatase [Chlorobiota bacterium]
MTPEKSAISPGIQRGILLVNLGSPASPDVRDVRRYLRQFLMDEHIIDMPVVPRWLLVHGLIVPFRSGKSAQAYREIWRDGHSPLIAISRRVRELVQERVDLPVALGMRYGSPSILDGLESLTSEHPGLREIVVIPLYPHYAMSTFETVLAEAMKMAEKLPRRISLKTIPPFYDHPRYIEALAAQARDALEGGYDHLLFSYHGVPERHVRKSDPTGSHCLGGDDCCEVEFPAHQFCYRRQALATTRLFVEKLNLPAGRYSVSFQSRLGRDQWLQPYTVDELVRLATAGVKKLAIICPSFVTDCLETLEEIGIQGRKAFLDAGGEEFILVPCLNDHPLWIDMLVFLCTQDVIAPYSFYSGAEKRWRTIG